MCLNVPWSGIRKNTCCIQTHLNLLGACIDGAKNQHTCLEHESDISTRANTMTLWSSGFCRNSRRPTAQQNGSCTSWSKMCYATARLVYCLPLYTRADTSRYSTATTLHGWRWVICTEIVCGHFHTTGLCARRLLVSPIPRQRCR